VRTIGPAKPKPRTTVTSRVLRLLRRSHFEHTRNDIARRLRADPYTVTYALRGLRRRGLVYATPPNAHCSDGASRPMFYGAVKP
jgi:predicted transcriptional regulator